MHITATPRIIGRAILLARLGSWPPVRLTVPYVLTLEASEEDIGIYLRLLKSGCEYTPDSPWLPRAKEKVQISKFFCLFLLV